MPRPVTITARMGVEHRATVVQVSILSIPILEEELTDRSLIMNEMSMHGLKNMASRRLKTEQRAMEKTVRAKNSRLSR